MLIEIYGKDIYTEHDFHVQFNKYAQWTYYGHNLNALWDVLTGIELPVHLIWYNSDISKKLLGARFHMIVEIFDEVNKFYASIPSLKENERLTYELK